MIFNFPRTKFVETASIDRQVSHVASEAAEADEAVLGDKDLLAMELMDVIHTAEGALMILDEQHGVDLDAVQAAVIKKNMERGYYV
jgi:predicted HAD superfamily Cof-like phosphohydrolase